jgi:hypothetical protein
MKICFDCLNSTSGMCDTHTQKLEKEYVDCTFTTINKDEIIKDLRRQREQLIKEIKKKEREFMLLFAISPLAFMAMIILFKTDLILFIGFGIFWYYADKFYRKLK